MTSSPGISDGDWPDVWAEVGRLALERGLRLEIIDDPDHPENPWIRLTDEPEDPPSVTA